MPGTYYGDQAALANNNAVPPKIKCSRCRVIKNSSAFSNKQLLDLVAEMKRQGINPTVKTLISCTSCTGGQVVELHCFNCDKTKGLEAFSKAQRRNPDHAMCWTCAEDRANFEPGAEDSDVSGGSGSDYDSDATDNSDDFGAGPLAAATASMSISGSNARSSSNGGVALNSSTDTRTASYGSTPFGSSKAPSTAITSSNGNSQASFDPGAYRKGLPSVASSASKAPQNTGNRNFAKAPTTKHRIVFDYAEKERQRKFEDAEGSDVEVNGSDSD